MIRKPILKKRWGMYAEQFELLQVGDVIKGKGGDLRIIERVSPSPKAKKGTYYIELLKLRPSWTKGDYTCYTIGDAHFFRPVKVKNPRIWELDREQVIKKRKVVYEKYRKKKVAELTKKLKSYGNRN